ncbi:MAG TPA: VOC family protein [Caulobacteraceae bacterium]|jgi:catechol 2,3-dioxygenase-like lactoylglutathione lyase family enzyme|nr:VOC family protein [Caulobacteraceae bacterium]
MLGKETMVAFLATSRPDAARAFFEGVLGLTFVHEHEHLVVFSSGAALLSLQKTDIVTPPRGTALGWDVKDLRGVIEALVARGVRFERFEGMEQDELGIWRPGGPTTGVAWFKDPDGNLLSLSQGG